jgi:hypothetical protein
LFFSDPLQVTKIIFLPLILDDPASVLDDMTMSLRFSKAFSKALPGTIEYTQPYWRRAAALPAPNDITLTAWVTDKNYGQLIQIADMWKGKTRLVIKIKGSWMATRQLCGTSLCIILVNACF